VINTGATNLTYYPDTDYVGTDTFWYVVQDDGGLEATGRVSVTVTPVNDAPVFNVGTNQDVNENCGAMVVPGWATGINDGDPETNQTLTFLVSNDSEWLFSAQPAVAANGTLTYTPALNSNGAATVSVQLVDDTTAGGAAITSAVQQFYITVNSVNWPPVANPDSATVEEEGWVVIPVTANDTDADGDALQVYGVNNGLHGTAGLADLTGTNLYYQPDTDWFGTDTFTYVVGDPWGLTATGTVTVVVTNVNDAPVLLGGVKSTNVTMSEDGVPVPFDLTLTAADVDGDTLTWSIITSGTLGSATAEGTGLSKAIGYVPATNVNGADWLEVQVDDGHGGTDAIWVYVTIDPANDAPSFLKGANQVVLEDCGPQTVDPWATAIEDGDPDVAQTLTFIVSNSLPALFSAQPAVSAWGALTYEPAANASGVATCTVALADDASAGGAAITTAVQQFTITVTPQNDPPLASNDTVAAAVTVPVVIPVLANDSDPDGDSLAIISVTQGSCGAVVINPGGTNVTYTPLLGWTGTDAFSYQVSDGHGGLDWGLVTVDVRIRTRITDLNVGSDFTDPTALPALTGYANSLPEFVVTYGGYQTFAQMGGQAGSNLLLYAHGHNAFALSATEQTNLFAYLDHGGLLWADDCNATWGVFLQSIVPLLEAHYGVAAANLPSNHPLFHCYYDFDPATYPFGAPPSGLYDGPARGITIPWCGQTRTIAVFTPHDYGCALEGGNGAGFQLLALRLGVNMLTYAQQGRDQIASAWSITATAGPNGSLSPSGVVWVPETSNETFTIAADPGYGVLDVVVDGASIGATNTYTFSSVTADHTISAVFVADTADLAVTKAIDDPSPEAGDVVTYTLTVSNAGPGAASSATITDLLPPEVRYVSHSNGTYTASNGLWEIGSLIAGARTSLTIQARVQFPAALLCTITNPTPAEFEGFGWTIRPLGTDRLVVSAPQEDEGGVWAGLAYILGLDGTLRATLSHPAPVNSNMFGMAVAVLGSDKVAVGVSRDDLVATDSGAVYLFDTNGTVLVTITNPTPDAGDAFGVAIDALGADRFVVGASADDTGAANAGVAYVFDASGALLLTLTNPAPAANDRFGSSVAALGTDRIVVGASGDDAAGTDAGSFYVFDTNGLLLATVPNPAPEASDGFGGTVAAVGASLFAVGAQFHDVGAATNAGAAYLYSGSGALLATLAPPVPEAQSNYGRSVAAVGTDRVLVGAPYADVGIGNVGEAYLFGTNGALVGTITNPAPAGGTLFGLGLRAVGPGWVAVSAPNAYVGGVQAGAVSLFGLGRCSIPITNTAALSASTPADANGANNTGTVAVVAHVPNSAPVPGPDIAQVAEDSAVLVSVLADDADADLDALTVASVSQGGFGTVGINAGATNVTYTPLANSNGVDRFTYVVSDGVGGAATGTVTVTVTPVNDPPVFSKGADQAVDENAGPQTVSGWATGIDDGDPEVSQTLTFIVSNSLPALFSAPPAVAANGTLTYTPAAWAYGVATGYVALADDTSAGGAAITTAVQTFTITVTATPPVLACEPAGFGFAGLVYSAIAPQTLVVSNAGGSAMDYTIGSSVFWLSVSNASGSLAAGSATQHTVCVATRGLAPRTYPGRLTVSSATATNSPQTVPVTLTVTSPAMRSAVAVWGRTADGQGSVPADLTNAVAISGGGWHTMALRSDRTVAVWGAGRTTTAAATNVVEVSAGGWHMVALRANGSIVAWGDSGEGRLVIPTSATNVVSIAAGGGHTLALRADGSVIAWGTNDRGQTNTPASATGIVAVAAGRYHSLALRPDGSVLAWGDSSNGKTNVPASATNIVALAGGFEHTLAVRADGTVLSWGGNANGETNVPASATDVVTVAAVGWHSMALRANGTAVAWGLNSDGQTNVLPSITNAFGIAGGYYHSSAVGPGVKLQVSSAHGSPAPGTGTTWWLQGLAVTASVASVVTQGSTQYLCAGWAGTGSVPASGPSNRVTFAVANDSTLTWRWSTNYWLALQSVGGGTVDVASAWQPAGSSMIVRAYPLPTFGFVRWTGDTNGCTIAGAELTAPMDRPRQIVAEFTQAAIAVGPATLCFTGQAYQALADAGTLTVTNAGAGTLNYTIQPYFWLSVSNASGSLAAGSSTQHAVRVSTRGLPPGTHHGWLRIQDPLAQNSPQSVQAVLTLLPASPPTGVAAWGRTNDNECTVPAGLTNAVRLAGGQYHALAVRADGSVVAWGRTNENQCAVPAGLDRAVAAAGGGYHSLALRADGTVTAWGLNGNGQCNVPAGLSNVVAIGAGRYYSVALLADGTLRAWGKNDYGQRDVPADVSNAVAVSVGAYHALALRGDGTVRAWGMNIYGQCNVPTWLSNAVAVAAGDPHSTAMRADGTVVAWGRNTEGQCNVPPGLSNGVALASGEYHSLVLMPTGTLVPFGYNDAGQTNVPAGLSNVADLACGSRLSLVLRDNDWLTVVSAHGTPTPAVGTQAVAKRSTQTCSGGSAATVGATQYVCRGWSGAGSVPASGSSNSVTFMITTDSAVTWLWTTNVQFTRTAGANGSVSGATNGWYALGGNVTVTGVPASGYHFAGWTGDVPPAQANANPLTLSMGQPRSVTATFANSPPVANADTLVTTQGVAAVADVRANDTDPESSPLSITSATQGRFGGVVAVNAGLTVTYTPAAGWFGGDAFEYAVSDGHGGTATGQVSVFVWPTNVVPASGWVDITNAQPQMPLDVRVDAFARPGGVYRLLGADNSIDGPWETLAVVTNPPLGFSYTDTGIVGHARCRFYQAVNEQGSAPGTNPAIYAAYVREFSAGKWHELAMPVACGSNRLDGVLGEELARGLRGDNLNGDLLYVLGTGGVWQTYLLNTLRRWTTNDVACSDAVSPALSVWIKRRGTGAATNAVYTGPVHTNAEWVTFRSNDWHMIAWPWPRPRREDTSPPGWGFAAAGAKGGTSWMNADQLVVGSGTNAVFYWLNGAGRWCPAGSGTPAGSLELRAGEGYYYYHGGTGFTWRAEEVTP
jgi:uncharacterized repeat protein (TIGR01451 family)